MAAKKTPTFTELIKEASICYIISTLISLDADQELLKSAADLKNCSIQEVNDAGLALGTYMNTKVAVLTAENIKKNQEKQENAWSFRKKVEDLPQ